MDFLHFSATLASIISMIKSLNKVILDYSDRPNKIVKNDLPQDIYIKALRYIVLRSLLNTLYLINWLKYDLFVKI